MLLTEQQLYEIRQVIMDHHQAFIVNAIGPNAVDPAILQGLKDKGLVNVKMSSIEDAYLYGHVLAMMDDPKVATMTYEQFKQYVQKNPIPLSPIEKQAVNFAQHQAAQYVKGLGNKVELATGNILIEADAAQRQMLRDTIKNKTAENIAKRESLKKLKSELGWASKDWARDWDRIAVTEKQNVMQRGVADHYAKRYGGDVRVAKRLMPGACKHCLRLHLGPDGHPRIFKLAELEANGTNVGRKAADWLPVVGTVHPHCQCQMIRIPEGWGFNDDGSLVPGGEYGIEYENEEELKMAMLQELDLQKSYKLAGRTKFQGIPIAIENNVGSVRKWKDGMGGEGETTLLHAYGYIERTTGADEDEVDVFLGPDPRAAQAYIVHQRNVQTDVYDEDKVMLGFPNQEQALTAYVQNYNRPDFAITCTAMDMDAFKRWVASTEAKPGEMFKSGTGGVRYVMPMEKSVSKEVATAASVTGAATGNPSPGTGSNYIMSAPERNRAEPVKGIKETMKVMSDNSEGAVKRDKETYTFQEPMRKVFPMIIPENFHGEDELDEGKTKRRRKSAEHEMALNRGVTKNTADVKEQERIEKSDVTPVGGVTPGGYKKVAKDKYKKVEPEKSGTSVQSFAVFHGGKVASHKDDPDLTVLKVLKDKIESLQKFRDQHGIDGKVGVGEKYAILTITPAEMEKLKAYVPKKKVEKEKSKIEPTIPVDAADIHRLGDIEILHENDMEAPKVLPNIMQRGRAVSVVIGGETMTGEVRGYDYKGRPTLTVNGKRRVAEAWSHVSPMEAEAYKPSFSGLVDEALVKAGARQKKLVNNILGQNVVGKHDANEYLDWLRSHGQESYLVGGIVRDLVAGTSPKSTMTDSEVLETMKDVDIVSTAHPTTARQLMSEVSPDVIKNGVTNDHLEWGVLRSVGHGLGLDFSSLASGGTFDKATYIPDSGDNTVPADWDHNLEEDIQRRDFTCNALYYDTHNDVIIDPTGLGIADAQNKVLRLAPSPAEASKNASLHIRFWKFRMRGYTPEKETLVYIRKHAAKWLGELSSNPYRIIKDMYKAIGKHGDPVKNLADFRDVMYADGAKDLYDKYLKPLESDIIAKAKKKGPES